MLLLFVLLVLTFGISCWNAYVAGVGWSAAEGFMRLVLWAAIVTSACGFLEVSAIILGFIALAAHWITQAGMNALLSLTYLFIIVPVLGAGLIITIHSWMVAYKQRDFGSIGLAGYNTFAQGYNMYEAADGGISSALANVISFFKKSDDEDTSIGQVAVLLVLLVAGVIAGGLTWVFFHMGRGAALASPQQMARRATAG